MSADPTSPAVSRSGGGPQRLVGSMKHAVRRVADRVVEPYVERTAERTAARVGTGAPAPASTPEPTLPPPFAALHGALHEGRTLALADMPAGCDTVLSMGANGQWYFDWFDEWYGHIPHHVGVEAYMPRPEVLPDNVEWVDADLASPEGVAMVASGTVDLVFSGQNIEHLWPEQVQAFLVESNRVLRDGGWLVVDSPNRDLTAEYGWSMGEHTIEFTPDEATELLGLAGFEVASMKGIWLCRRDGALLPLEIPGTMEGSVDVLRRTVLATGRPDDSFIWWAEAKKVGEPDVERLGTAVREVFAANWRERVGRMQAGGAATVSSDGVPRTAGVAKGTDDYVILGPWMALRAGTYSVAVDVEWQGLTVPGSTVAVLEVVAGDESVASVDLATESADGSATVRCPFALDELRFAVHARLRSTGAADIRTPMTLRLEPDPYGVDRAG